MNKILLPIIFCLLCLGKSQGQSKRFFNSIEDLRFTPKEVYVSNSTKVKLNYNLKMYDGKSNSLNLSKTLNFKVKGAAKGIEAFKKHIITSIQELNATNLN